MYANYIKRPLDFLLSLLAITALSPLLLCLAIIGAIAMRGNPFFTQQRPGKVDPKTGRERIFPLIKFRTMSNEKNRKGELLPDERRLNGYGRFLRATSLDELPELFNILIGHMAIIGPRPQLVRDMVFMTPKQRKRHTVRPGLSGLAQVSGRNAIGWEEKLAYDLQYIQHITFAQDAKIVCQTVLKVLKSEGISQEDMATAEDYGDYLLRTNQIDDAFYRVKQEEAAAVSGNGNL